ncbi:NADPH-dependent 2,4-dienoyl-CoA reductase, sulfur reductase [Variovorax sp. HW608]|uniref:FAD/NAD(P)-dependent oxidoreductase n=1 Tax=Variovorax sp. HW608 TaxID=1034889 RepID=UPI0008201717|nr:FAD/NAD(P)-binding oxidoreductase [Variovorax sp. HW608]SCK22726.1 NADPH-dependent 2,4-dienoyl-CoA reductase, sulfur reductase [Variovorax sp. HW608]
MPAPSYELQHRSDPTLPPIVIGAGPAGVRAAATLVAGGLQPIVVDESPKPGGQIYRQPPEGFCRTEQELYGTEAGRAVGVHTTFDRIRPDLDHRPNTMVWNAQPDLLDLIHAPTREVSSLPWRDVIVATGATDRVLPLPGWTLPGVFTLGGAQVALKFQGCAIGDSVVFAGTGPLLYLVACQYAKAGAKVEAVLDTAPASARYRALPALLAQPMLAAKGLYLTAWLRLNGVPIHHGVELLRAQGARSLEHVLWRDSAGRERRTACTAMGLGYALRPETQLADLLGCEFEFSPLHRCHVPRLHDSRRSSVPGVYLAGDGAGILGADAAEWSGELAAWALLEDRQLNVDRRRMSKLRRKLAGTERFRHALERAFPFPENWAERVDDELVVCRCENISAGELRQTAVQCGTRELNRLKALSRVGMGRCQGRMCAAAATEILAQAQSVPLAQVGRLRSQAPVKPLPVDVVVREDAHA